MGIVDKQHVAGGAAHHLQAVSARLGNRQAEHAAALQILQNRGDAILVHADQGGPSPLDHPQFPAACGGEVPRHIVRAEGLLHRLETAHHPTVILIADILKQRAHLQFPLGHHGVRTPFCCIYNIAIIPAFRRKVKPRLWKSPKGFSPPAPLGPHPGTPRLSHFPRLAPTFPAFGPAEISHTSPLLEFQKNLRRISQFVHQSL